MQPDRPGKTILILGGGVMQLPSVRIAKRRGWKVIVAAARISEEIEALADGTEAVDLRDREAVTAAAMRTRRTHGLDGVFTAGTDFSTTVAWVAEKLSLPGVSYACALAATDKARMRETLDRQGVPGARFFTVEREQQKPPSGFAFPLVVKPVDNMGARGVRRVDDEGQLRRAVSEALKQSGSSRAIVEEYLEGPELSLDAVACNGEITICGIADRHICFAPYFVEMGHTMPSALEDSLLQAAGDVFVRGIRALGIENGAAKGDIKITSRGPVVGEIAARLSGGYMSGWTYPLSCGVEVTEAALNIALGDPPGDLEPSRDWVSAERAFISIPGRVGALEGLEQAQSEPWIEELFLRTAAGEMVQLPVNNMGKCGNIISNAPSRREAVEAAEAATRCVLVRLNPNEETTESFLAGSLQSGFSAFAGLPESPAARIKKIPASAGNPDVVSGDGTAIEILSIPGLDNDSRDWHGFSMREAVERVGEMTAVRCVEKPSPGRLCLGGIFWKALVKGGVQAGIYVIDSLRAPENDPKILVKRWSSWK